MGNVHIAPMAAQLLGAIVVHAHVKHAEIVPHFFENLYNVSSRKDIRGHRSA